MEIKEIDGKQWRNVDKVIPGLDILEEYLLGYCEIIRQDSYWYLVNQRGEQLYMGSTIRELLINVILGG